MTKKIKHDYKVVIYVLFKLVETCIDLVLINTTATYFNSVVNSHHYKNLI